VNFFVNRVIFAEKPVAPLALPLLLYVWPAADLAIRYIFSILLNVK